MKQLHLVAFVAGLTDYDLIRRHMAEADQQIIEVLTSDCAVAPSDLDL